MEFKKIFSCFCHSKPVLLSRTACLGNFIFDKLKTKGLKIKNHQKSRIDYILNCHENKSKMVKADCLKSYISREDIMTVIEQSQKDFFSYENVKVIILDSFSELTDKLFVSKNGWTFCAHYGDIDHSSNFDNNFTCEDLLSAEKLKDYYTEFFAKTRAVYGEIPIIFLHFPTKFETRELYQQRAEIISDTIKQLTNDYNNLYSLKLEDELVIKNQNDDFPYHFDDKTLEAFLDKVLDLKIKLLKRKKKKRNLL